MQPMTEDKATQFWLGVAAAVTRGDRVLLVAEDADARVLGTVQIILNLPENQPHRADVTKMLVHPDARRRGIAARLLAALDEEARAEGRNLLVLDAVTDGDAARLYARSGWTAVGDIPDYALMPDGAFCSATIFYKRV